MMFCSKCGTENVEYALFCKNCGTQLTQQSSSSPAVASHAPAPNGGKRMRRRGTSNVPLILGITGGVIGLPASYCSGMCAAVVDASANSGDELTKIYLYGTLIICLACIVIACMTKKYPRIAGVVILVLSACGLVLFAVTMNILGIVAMVLTVLSGIFSLVQKTELV